MRLACFISGTGTNVIKIVEHRLNHRARGENCPYETVLIFIDVKDEGDDEGNVYVDKKLMPNDLRL
jgi:folate-dependent phosphoribosylglycinamide formyltransferase PurN